ncbi:hypothetical protein I4U23_031480 [Adineta vaga]|nr:hypothetical protein I4U23_031480 [Adineta vaga]
MSVDARECNDICDDIFVSIFLKGGLELFKTNHFLSSGKFYRGCDPDSADPDPEETNDMHEGTGTYGDIEDWPVLPVTAFKWIKDYVVKKIDTGGTVWV